MKVDLITYAHVTRENFLYKHFSDTDNIFVVSECGNYTVNYGSGEQFVSELEAFDFKSSLKYTRKALSPISIHLFRYKSDTDIFPKNKIIFNDKSRIKSTLNMLNSLEKNVFFDAFEIRCSVFNDFISLYRIEQRMNVSIIKDEVVADAINFINNRFYKVISVADIASRYNISYIQLLRRFKAVTNITISEYIIHLRMKKACSLLSKTNLPIKEISLQCGFENEYYFSNFFKKYYCSSPTIFRKTSNK